MDDNVLRTILRDYDEKCKLHDEFIQTCKRLIEELLRENNIRVHSVSARLKEKDSLTAKIKNSSYEFKNLNEITDICGIRIITYFSDEVDAISEIILKEFQIDEEHSVDKRAILDPDRFGYLSLHYIATLLDHRLRLAEYRRFSDCKVEIQMRSILQHTWAEIEHDLGYKNKFAVPREIMRRFSRLAGLLELADDEFIQIRDRLIDYESSLPNRVIQIPESVLIDKASLATFVDNSTLVKSIDHDTIAITKHKLIEKEASYDDEANRLTISGFKNIAEIDSFLQKYRGILPRFIKNLVGENENAYFYPGACLFYLPYLKVALENSVDLMFNFLNLLKIPSAKSLSKQLIDAYNKAVA